jgi:hypothetical protein
MTEMTRDRVNSPTPAEADRKARLERIGERVSKLVLHAFTQVIRVLLNGWLLMMTVTIAREYWIAAIPPIGYWASVLLVLLVDLMVQQPIRMTKEDR